ncbi:MAG: lactonase family protein [Acidobacteriaceae bacterium]
MTRPTLWNRRTFLQRLGYFSGFGVVRPGIAWSLSKDKTPLQEQRAVGSRTGSFYAYVGSWEQGIQVFSADNNAWKLSQTIDSNKPSCLTMHPSRKFIYAANEIDNYQGLPTGTVEAYSVDGRDGRLTLLNRQPLSLSAISPRYLVVSPDGSTLIVAVHGGGSYNLLPIRADGHLERVSGILKEVGSGPDQERQNTAHPQMVLFDSSQRHLISADLGSDRLNVFTLANDRLIVAQRHSTEPGRGPRFLALHPLGRLLYVGNELDASISCFDYDAARGRILNRLHEQPLHTASHLQGATAVALAMHSSGNFLYTACSNTDANGSARSGIAVWRIDPATGELGLIHESDRWIRSSYVESMIVAHNALFVLSQAEGVFRLAVDPISGVVGSAVQVAKVSAPGSMVLQ